MNISLRFIFLFSFLSVSGISQTTSEILKELNLKYFNTSYQMDYKISGYNVDEQVYLYRGRVATKGTQRLVENDYEATIFNYNYFLYVNHNRRIVVFNDIRNIQKQKKNQESQDIEVLLALLDSTLQKQEVNLTVLQNSYKLDLIQDAQSDFQNIFFTIGKDFTLQGVSYYMKSPEGGLTQIEVEYRNVLISDKISDSVFSTSKYIKGKGKKIELQDKYTNYTFIDQRELDIEGELKKELNKN